MPGLVALALGLGAGLNTANGDGLLAAIEIAGATLFTGISLLLVWFGQRLYLARRAASARAQELEDQQAQLRAILGMIPEAMTVIDAEGTIRFFSPAAERLFGYGADEVIGRNVAILMPAPHKERHDGYIRRYLDTGERRIIGKGRPLMAQRKDGSSVPIELYVGEIQHAGMHYFAGFMRDLTDQRATESRMRQLQAELVHMSRLTALGEMASSLAHELNQPLAAIANYLRGCHRLLADTSTPAPPALREALGKAADQALRAGNIVRSLREFVARGDHDHNVEQLGTIIQETSALALVGAKEQGISAHFDIDSQADPILADKVQIQQVLLNLMRNAMEAMEGQPMRDLRVASRLRADGMIEVAVADTGPGIAPDIEARLFQPFVTSKARGMGVGLSICRTIVESHGGRIWAEPGAQGGTVFKFTLPHVRQEEVAGD
ncbi:MAG: PAS domain S-box protein [Alphaproteobacteria bacterium]|nr:MAG: PAS domain S-box protein [Alphaproteobacteria bacterium]